MCCNFQLLESTVLSSHWSHIINLRPYNAELQEQDLLKPSHDTLRAAYESMVTLLVGVTREEMYTPDLEARERQTTNNGAQAGPVSTKQNHNLRRYFQKPKPSC